MPGDRSGSGRRQRNSGPGLRVVTRKGVSSLYLRGTIAGVSIFESLKTSDPRLAEEARIVREFELQRHAIHGTEEAKPDVTFAAAAFEYMEHEDRTETTLAKVTDLLTHFGPKTTCREIDQSAIDKAGKAICREGTTLPSRQRRVTTPIKAILTFAAIRKWCEVPAFEKVKQPKKNVVWFQPSEAEALISAAAPHLKPILVFLFCTGARISEALTLDWANVNLQHARVTFLGEREDGSRGTKSELDRIVDLVPRAVAALGALPGARAGHVFLNHRSQPYRRNDDRPKARPGAPPKPDYGGQIRKAFGTALEEAEIKRRMTPHDCRRTWATWSYATDRDLMRLRDDGGWATTVLVEKYAKLAPPELLPEILAFWGLKKTNNVQAEQPTALRA